MKDEFLRYHPNMTLQERDIVCERLRNSLHLLIEDIEGLNNSQWGFKPDGNTWSAAQCVEHLTGVETGVYGRIQTLLSEGFSDPQLCIEAQGKERLIGKAVPNRTRRAQAPRRQFLLGIRRLRV